MNKDIKKKWVDALRSGEYEQGQELLRTEDDKFCCLGVLCDIAVKEGVTPPPQWKDNGVGVMRWHYGVNDENYSSALLPSSVANWAFAVDGGKFGFGPEVRVSPSRVSSLTSLNDRGETFETIANLIEEHL